MSTFEESNLTYDSGDLDETLQALAQTVPRAMGAACEDEEYLCGRLLKAKKVRLTDEPAIDPLFRVDYEFWTAPSQFYPSSPERVIYRREHLYVRGSVLASRELYVYGLGPEFGFEKWFNDDWVEGDPTQTALPKDGHAALLEKITCNHLNEIAEFLVDDGECHPQGISNALQKIYYDVEMTRRQADKTGAIKEEKRDIERNQLAPAWDLTTLDFIKNKDGLTLRIFSPEKQFIWTVSVPFSLGEQYPLITLSKGEKVPSPLGYVSIQKITVKCPYAISPESAETMLRDLISSGWVDQQMEQIK